MTPLTLRAHEAATLAETGEVVVQRLGPWEQAADGEAWARFTATGWPAAWVGPCWELEAGGRVLSTGPETGPAGRDAADRSAVALGWTLDDDAPAGAGGAP